MSDWCLVTDIDGTVVGEEESTRALRRAVLRERARLARRNRRLYWVIATGRRLASTREVLLEEGFHLDDFDALVTSVGAELYLRGESSPNDAYHAHLQASGFERPAVEAALGELDFLEPQPRHEQFPHKVSYVMKDTPEGREAVHAALSRLPFETQTVFAHDEYLDVTPTRGAKGGAVAHLLERWQIPKSRAVAAGDSGNDVSMLDRDWHGIVVGNGRRHLAHLGERSNLYFANGKYAAGIIEGLVALGFLSAARLAKKKTPG
jgi:sucrose-phosphate synthase